METVNNREPIFGSNAKAFAIQALTAVVVLWLANRYLRPFLDPYAEAAAKFIVGLF